MFQPKTTILCCGGTRCPVVTQVAENAFNLTDDFGNAASLNANDLSELARLGHEAGPKGIVRYRNTQMLGEQAALARNALAA